MPHSTYTSIKPKGMFFLGIWFSTPTADKKLLADSLIRIKDAAYMRRNNEYVKPKRRDREERNRSYF